MFGAASNDVRNDDDDSLMHYAGGEERGAIAIDESM